MTGYPVLVCAESGTLYVRLTTYHLPVALFPSLPLFPHQISCPSFFLEEEEASILLGKPDPVICATCSWVLLSQLSFFPL